MVMSAKSELVRQQCREALRNNYPPGVREYIQSGDITIDIAYTG